MQEITVGPMDTGPRDVLSGQSLFALLALVGTRRMGVEELKRRTTLNASAFRSLLAWLQQEYLVDVISALDGNRIEETVELTDRGESVLVSMLEKTCELLEFC